MRRSSLVFARQGAGCLIGASALLYSCGKIAGLSDVPPRAGNPASGGGTASTDASVGESGTASTDASVGESGAAGEAPTAGAGGCADASPTGECSVCKVDPLCSALGTVCSDKSTAVTCAKDSQGCFYQASALSCGGAKSVCSKGACVECMPGDKRCDYYAASNSVQTCGANGKWGTEAVPCDSTTPWCSVGICGQPPSCGVSTRGTNNCGANVESCCTSLPVVGGTFYRTYTTDVDGGLSDPDSGAASEATGLADPATVSTFRMDKYLVTVGRFRQFVLAWAGSASAMPWRPTAGEGVHLHLHDAKGLLDSSSLESDAGLPDSGSTSSYEPGWQSAYADQVQLTDAILGSCDASTWTPDVGPHENLPINCIDWFEAFAFCIWDRGYLPSEAEWEYAAAGGSQQREYPWGSADPGTINEYAIYNCSFIPGTMPQACYTPAYVAPVGSAPQGQGLWGQLDLAGDVWEYALDWYAPYTPCVDCANVLPSSTTTLRTLRGGNFRGVEQRLLSSNRGSADPKTRVAGWGARCVRPP